MKIVLKIECQRRKEACCKLLTNYNGKEIPRSLFRSVTNELGW